MKINLIQYIINEFLSELNNQKSTLFSVKINFDSDLLIGF